MSTAVVYLVRHAHAGSRASWSGQDELRPLSAKGRSQAAAVTDVLHGHGVRRVVSSASLRCVQTVEPLARLLGTGVVEDERWYEGSPAAAAIDALLPLSDERAAVCSHGDVIGAVLLGLREAGAEIPEHAETRKAAIWILEFPRGPGGHVVGRQIPPPE